MRITSGSLGLRTVFFAVGLIAGGALPAVAASNEGDALISAVQDGLDGKVEALLAQHANVNATNSAGASALSWAIIRNNDDLAGRLLKAHANPNLADANHVAPLMLAIGNASLPSVELLLAAGADPDGARANGETPLMVAVHMGLTDIVQLLLAHKADVNARETRFGQTALMWAAGRPDLVRLLLDHGADTKPVTKSWDVTTTIYMPIIAGLRGGVVVPWNNHGDYYTAKAGGFSALLFAVQADDIESVKMLLDAGMDVNQASAGGITPLLMSLYHWRPAPGKDSNANSFTDRFGAQSGLKFTANLNMAGLLLDRGAKADVSDAGGHSPLHGAVLGMSPGFVLGAIPWLSVQKAPAPVHEAEALALIKRLLDQGADPNKATVYPFGGPIANVRIDPLTPGSTPLHAAALIRSTKLVELLVSHNANCNQLRKDGYSPFAVAALFDNLPVVETMAAHGADLAMTYDTTDEMLNLDRSKSETRRHQTILHITGAGGASAVVEYLIGKGVPANVVNDHGETAMQLADMQEFVRYDHQQESEKERALKGEKNGDVNREAVRSTDTTDAFRRALGIKTARK